MADGPTEHDFEKINLSEKTLTAIRKMGFSKMTPIQAQTIPRIIAGQDIIGAAKTGSGKTLAFLVPALEILDRNKFEQRNGVGVLIISPTRELALQIYGVARELCAAHSSRSLGLVMGGCHRGKEAKRLAKNVSLLVATPGRLLDHLKNTSELRTQRLLLLVIDEADRILDNGFEEEMRQILARLPKKRQTALFSATQTKKTEDLAKLSFHGAPLYVGVDDGREHSTREGLVQGFIRVKAEEKFLVLFSFLKLHRRLKTIVFLSTCSATKFFADLLGFVGLPVLQLHGKLKQSKRTATFFEFADAKEGVLLATDVAARGLDIPAVDWILQFDPPGDAKAYIHRVGRTARGLSGKGRALLFLLPSELGFLRELAARKVPLKENDFSQAKVARVQPQLEQIIDENFYLAKAAREAYRSYLQAYAQQSGKGVFDVHSLDVYKVAKAFGFSSPPRVHLNISLGGKKSRKRLLHFAQQNAAKSKQFCRW